MASPSAQPIGQVVCFRARYHSFRKGYVTVRVFRTRALLHLYARLSRLHHPFLGHEYVGLASTWDRFTRDRARVGRLRRTPEYGEILFIAKHLSPEIITHECAHLAFGYARRRHLRLDQLPARQAVSEDEEHFCYAMGGLTASVTAGLRRCKLIAPVKEP